MSEQHDRLSFGVYPKVQHFGIGGTLKVDMEIRWTNGVVKKITKFGGKP